MPTSFLSADAGFPRLTADIPAEERMNRIQNYLYMLLEQLRYALYNLGKDNFNEADLQEIAEEIRGPVLSVVSDLEGNVSILEQTASSLTTQISNAQGDISTLQQTASSLTTQISNAQGDISTLQQTASGLTTAVSNLGGDISVVSQKADRIDWIVASGTSASTMSLTSEMASLIANEISITGTVTFNDLETAGRSVINGDNIELKADADGDSVSYLTYTSVNGSTFAQIHTRDNQSSSTLSQDRYAFVIETPERVDGGYCAMKLEAGDSMSLEAGELLFLHGGRQIVLNDGGAYGLPVRIQGSIPYDPYWSSTYIPADCYIFCSDGIYYNGTRIVST